MAKQAVTMTAKTLSDANSDSSSELKKNKNNRRREYGQENSFKGS